MFAAIYTFAGMTMEQYEQLITALGLRNGLPGGMQFLLAGMAEEGWRIVMLWKGAIPYDDWMLSKFQPACQKMGLQPIPGTFKVADRIGI